MKTIAMKNYQTDESRASSVESRKFGVRRSAGSQPSTAPRTPSGLNSQPIAGFTIVELLVVIAIIAILAALLLPVLGAAKVNAQKKQAAVEISQIVGAIQQYDSVYGRFPVSKEAQAAASIARGDFTYGTNGAANATINVANPASYNFNTNNSEVIAILMDIIDINVTAVNTNHQKNPQQTVFLSAKRVSDSTSPGVGSDLVYRDPWGKPYIISMDLNYDEQCKDAFYSLQAVSQKPPLPAGYVQTGYNGLFNPNTTASDNFLYHGKVMVWSAGPDQAISNAVPANVAPNQDNILSWQ